MCNEGLFLLLLMVIPLNSLYCKKRQGEHYKLFNRSCYIHIGRCDSQDKAKGGCEHKGAFLAEPRSRKEVCFIIKHNKGTKPSWTGGKLVGDVWKWVKSGDVINWGGFGSFQPYGEGECLQIENKDYVSQDNEIIKKDYCIDKGEAICQMPASETPYYEGQTNSKPEPEQDICNLYEETPHEEDHKEETKIDQETKTCVSQLDCGIHTSSDINGSCVCACLKGYKNVDNQTCVDVDECSTSPSVCGDENCVNTEGSFTCKETGFFEKPAWKIAGVAIAVVGTAVASVGIASMLTGFFSKASGTANPLQTDGNQKDIDGVNADGLKEAIKKTRVRPVPQIRPLRQFFLGFLFYPVFLYLPLLPKPQRYPKRTRPKSK